MEPLTTILDQDFSQPPVSRRKIQPWWMKTFSWIFMVCAAFTPIVIGMAIFGIPSKLAFYGIETFDGLSLTGITLCAIFLLKGVTGFALWFEKDWAINIAFADMAVGLIACVYSMVAGHSSFRLEIAFIFLFFYGILKLKKQW